MESVDFEVYMSLNFCSRTFTGAAFFSPSGAVWNKHHTRWKEKEGKPLTPLAAVLKNPISHAMHH